MSLPGRPKAEYRSAQHAGTRVSPAILNQFLVDITRGHLKDDFIADGEAVLGGSMLDEGTKTAIRARDVGALWLAEAHPMALMYFARQSGWDNDRYYSCIERAETTKSVPVAGSAPIGSGQPRTR